MSYVFLQQYWWFVVSLLGALLVFLLFVQEITVQSTSSQDDAALPSQWDLQTCIDYALQHNITLKRNRISAESAEVDVKTAKAALFPSLSASVSQRIVNRPNSETNTIIDGDNITTVAMVLMPVGPSTMAASA